MNSWFSTHLQVSIKSRSDGQLAAGDDTVVRGAVLSVFGAFLEVVRLRLQQLTGFL